MRLASHAVRSLIILVASSRSPEPSCSRRKASKRGRSPEPRLPPRGLPTKRLAGEDMSDKDPSVRRPNRPKLALHVPEPPMRPGDKADFSFLQIPAAGSAPRPDTAAPASETYPLADTIVRVLDEEHQAVGPWAPRIAADVLRKMLRDMVTVRT